MSRRILIIDDERAFADVLAELLAEEGYTVVRAHDGITALNMLGAERLSPDLGVSDVMLPGLKGDRVVDELVTQPRRSGVMGRV
jgi:CheY-like chemotaxis protein